MEKNINMKQIYAEVYTVLSMLGGDYIGKIPRNVLNIIADQRDKDYIVNINDEQPLDEQNLSEEAIALLASLKLDYWCDSDDEKKAAIKGLQSAAGYVRREIGSRVNIRCVPEFTFCIDTTIEYGARINDLLHSVIKEDESND